ncbi:MAG: rhamnulokinase, partial [Planctomyces sp.]|nr:rhamnulokinase [Planctomyces sp.]
KTNQEVPDDEGAVIRCALESLALKYRQVLERLEGLSGHKTEVIHIVGGGSQNELLNQFAADACHRPVVAGPIEATALGNVLVQARTAGEIGSLADLRAIVRESASVRHYEPQNSAAWDDAYARFVTLPAIA